MPHRSFSSRLLLAAFAAAMLLAGLFSAWVRPVGALTNCTVSDLSVDSEEQGFLALINTYRSQNGAGALTMSANLNRAASWMAFDMATKNYFDHTDSLGRTFSTRI